MTKKYCHLQLSAPAFSVPSESEVGEVIVGPRLGLLNRFIKSALSPPKLSVLFPDNKELALDLSRPAVAGGWTTSDRDPRVRAMKIRTIKSRHSCAIPRRFSKITCGRVSKRPPRDGRRETSYLVGEVVDSMEKLALLVFQPPGLLLELYH